VVELEEIVEVEEEVVLVDISYKNVVDPMLA
jgi:hypothetical protein